MMLCSMVSLSIWQSEANETCSSSLREGKLQLHINTTLCSPIDPSCRIGIAGAGVPGGTGEGPGEEGRVLGAGDLEEGVVELQEWAEGPHPTVLISVSLGKRQELANMAQDANSFTEHRPLLPRRELNDPMMIQAALSYIFRKYHRQNLRRSFKRPLIFGTVAGANSRALMTVLFKVSLRH